MSEWPKAGLFEEDMFKRRLRRRIVNMGILFIIMIQILKVHVSDFVQML